jgi:hypothetical protein
MTWSYTHELELAALLVFSLSALLVVTTAPVGAQSATVSADDVELGNHGDVGATTVSVQADKSVSTAFTKVIVNNTSVANITGLEDFANDATDEGSRVANDGSYAWINYSEIGGPQNTSLADVVVESQTNATVETELKIETGDYLYRDNGTGKEFDPVNTNNGTVSTGRVTATVSAEDVVVGERNSTATSNISILSDRNVSTAHTKLTVGDTAVAKITGVQSVVPNKDVSVERDVAADGSYAWLNYSTSDDSLSDFILANVSLTSQTDNATRTDLFMQTADYNYTESGNKTPFEEVNTDNATVSVGTYGAVVSAEDVELLTNDSSANSTVKIDADRSVGLAETMVSVNNTSVGKITGVANLSDGEGQTLDYSIADDGSYVWINYSAIGGPREVSLADVEFTAQTGDAKAAEIALGTYNYGYKDSDGDGVPFDSVDSENATVFSGARSVNFQIRDVSLSDTVLVKGEILNMTVDVENVGNQTGTRNVSVEFNGAVSGSSTVYESTKLSAGESRSVEFSVDTEEIDYDIYDYTVTSGNSTAVGTLKVVENMLPAHFSIQNVSVGLGETVESRIKVDAPNGLASSDITVSVNSPRVRIADLSLVNGSLLETTDRNNTSVRAEYTNIGSGSKPRDETDIVAVDFELATKDINSSFTTQVRLKAENAKHGLGIPYATTDASGANFTGGIFTRPLVGHDSFVGPPTDTDQLNDSLYEDLSGDGDGTSVAQTVRVFGELLRGGLGLTEEQARKFDWDGRDTGEVTVSDMVTLFGKQIRTE